ncbi:mediator of RNA polymerase ii transcription subunit 22 [Anaeramoeba ignava]|uniref:Mediator of RNA polymerase ii transcription subunit 22 n=1 Tax=Anaeramoeba ignava TaxID=1746090 RepID=A0A9Q0LXQ2_ANAIG|nr:mediator of RNA polymerase ii transcription subunit 22 [Anaeramoeba ignava]KAJ5080494.1 mediator of RNA polymerase ii transcription subunit 22 [Anaeramoeba ignava]
MDPLKITKNEMELMIKNFSKIFDTAKINKNPQNYQETFQLLLQAEQIAVSSQNILQVISELKRVLIISDDVSRNKNIEDQKMKLKNQKEKNDSKLQEIRQEITAALYELETELYQPIGDLTQLKSINQKK